MYASLFVAGEQRRELVDRWTWIAHVVLIGELEAVPDVSGLEPLEVHRSPRRDHKHISQSAVVRVARCRRVVEHRCARAESIFGIESGEEFTCLIRPASANEAVVARIARERNAKHAVGVDVSDDDVCIIVETEHAAYSTAVGETRELCVNADAWSFAIGDGLRDDRITQRPV